MKTDQTPAVVPTRQSESTPRVPRLTKAHLTILVADDNQDDTFFLAEAFKKAGACATIHVVRDGQEAVNYLQGHRPYGNRAQFPFPDLLVTDSNLPSLTALELLDWVRQQRFSHPLVLGVLSGVEYEPQIEKAVALGAKFYFIKPDRLNDLVVIARHLAEKCAAGLGASEASAEADMAMGLPNN